MEAQELANQITSLLNSYGSRRIDDLISAMTTQHRTLQQQFTKLCLKWLEKCASEDYRFDDRNEASHKIADAMIRAWKNTLTSEDDVRLTPSQFIPLI